MARWGVLSTCKWDSTLTTGKIQQCIPWHSGFDMENTIICYLEIYLEVSGIKDVLDDKNILALILWILLWKEATTNSKAKVL